MLLNYLLARKDYYKGYILKYTAWNLEHYGSNISNNKTDVPISKLEKQAKIFEMHEELSQQCI